jgi:hypothetical protein
MVALIRTLRGFHLPQQCVHFIQGEFAIGAHSTMTRHGGQYLILRTLHHRGGIVLRQLSQHASS